MNFSQTCLQKALKEGVNVIRMPGEGGAHTIGTVPSPSAGLSACEKALTEMMSMKLMNIFFILPRSTEAAKGLIPE